jgi:hypothetical protein
MEVRDQLHAPASTPWKKIPVSIEQEAGWAPLSVWTFRRKEKYLSYIVNRTPDSPVHKLALIDRKSVV